MEKNRNLEAKRIKRIKQIKARPRYLKPDYGFIGGHKPPPNTGRLIPDSMRSLFAYRKRLDPQDERLPFIIALMNTLYPDLSKPVVKPRQEEHMRLLVNKMEPVERKLLVQNGRFVKMAMLSNKALDCVEFLEYQCIPGVLRRSVTYSSYDRAMSVFQQQTIRWKEVIQIPNVEPAPLE